MIAERTIQTNRAKSPAAPRRKQGDSGASARDSAPRTVIVERRRGVDTAAADVRPMARRGTKVMRRAQERPMMAAVLAASFLVSLAALHVAAFARVTAAGLEQAVLSRDCKAAARDEEALRAEISRLTLAPSVKARAVNSGMEANNSQTTQLVGVMQTVAAVAPDSLPSATDKPIIP